MDSSTPRRQHSRVSVTFAVRLQIGAQQVAARARNLSMTGLFLEDPRCDLPANVRLAIPLPGSSREVVADCRVERRDAQGVALSFASIDWDDLLLVARYLAPLL